MSSAEVHGLPGQGEGVVVGAAQGAGAGVVAELLATASRLAGATLFLPAECCPADRDSERR